MNIETDITYHFEVKEETCLDYKFTSSIIEWITGYLSELTDANNKRIFSKVNTGYNEDTLRSLIQDVSKLAGKEVSKEKEDRIIEAVKKDKIPKNMNQINK